MARRLGLVFLAALSFQAIFAQDADDDKIQQDTPASDGVSLTTTAISTISSGVDIDKRLSNKRPMFTPYTIDNYAMWEQFADEPAMVWKPSQVKKDGSTGIELQYKGKWAIEEPTVLQGVVGDKSLVAKSEAQHHAIWTQLSDPLDPAVGGVVFQYEVKFQTWLECGGAYAKLLTAPVADDFSDKTPYSIMFGPDKCGEGKVHFIFRHLNPITGEYTEHHLDQPPIPPADRLSHVYTLVINTNNTFSILIDNNERRTGSLYADFDPPVIPQSKIDDPSDEKPKDWVDEPEIPDPDAVKPEHWDEDAPMLIPDKDATIPKGWLEDEPALIEDPEAKKPYDWDDAEDGTWSAPLISNPRCDHAPGCGPWDPPMVHNPEFRGKWTPPLIPNPRYKGEWAPRRIQNPRYFEDDNLYRLSPIGGVGFEIWTMQSGIAFDNIYLGNSPSTASRIARDIWAPKAAVESEIVEVIQPAPPPQNTASGIQILQLFKYRFYEILVGIDRFHNAVLDNGVVGGIRSEYRGAFGVVMLTAAFSWIVWNIILVVRFFLRISREVSSEEAVNATTSREPSTAESSSSARVPSSGTAIKRR